MVKIINTFDEISANYSAIFCDLWGCLHNGQKAFPEALVALKEYKTKGGVVILLTNAPRPKQAIIEHLTELSIMKEHYDDIVTSGDAAQNEMLSGIVGQKVYHLGPERDLAFFNASQTVMNGSLAIQRVPLEAAEGIVCTGLFDDLKETPDDYKDTIKFGVEKNLSMLCANPDIFVDIGHRRVWCAGGIAQAYSKAGGKSLYFGKPHRPIYDLARKKLTEIVGAFQENKILCVGDGIQTDIKGAKLENLDSLFICGGLSNLDTGMSPQSLTPNPKMLNLLIKQEEIDVTAAIGYLQ